MLPPIATTDCLPTHTEAGATFAEPCTCEVPRTSLLRAQMNKGVGVPASIVA
jgi:hypothetical protein